MSADRDAVLEAVASPETWQLLNTCVYCEQSIPGSAKTFRGVWIKDTGGFRLFKMHAACEAAVRGSKHAREQLVNALRRMVPLLAAVEPGGHA